MLCSTIIAESGAPASPFMLSGGNLSDHLDTAASFGYHGVELQIADAERFNKEPFLLKCSRLGLVVTSIGTGLAAKEGLSLSAADDAVRAASVSRMMSQIDLAAKIGAGTIVQLGLLKGLMRNCPDEKTYFNNLGRSVTALARYAEKKEVVIAF